METGKWTALFVTLLSFNIATALLEDILGGGGGGGGGDLVGGLVGGVLGGGAAMGGKSNFSGWSETCSCNEELEGELDEALDSIRDKIKQGFSLKDQKVQGAEMSDGAASGFHRFERKGPYRCKVKGGNARIYFQIGFARLVFSYIVSAAEGFFGNVFGDLATAAADVLAEAGDLACKLGFPDIVVDVILRQDFGGNGGIEMEEFSLGAMNGMTFLEGSGPLQAAADVLTPIFYPAFQVIISTLLQTDVQKSFKEEFSKVHAERYMFVDSAMDDDDDDIEIRGRGRGRGRGGSSSVTVRGGRGGARGGVSISGGGRGGGRGGRYSESVSIGGGGGGGRRGGRAEFVSSSSGMSSSRSDASSAGSRVYYTYEEDYDDE